MLGHTVLKFPLHRAADAMATSAFAKTDMYNTLEGDGDMSTIYGNGRATMDLTSRTATGGDVMPSARVSTEYSGDEYVGDHGAPHSTPHPVALPPVALPLAAHETEAAAAHKAQWKAQRLAEIPNGAGLAVANFPTVKSTLERHYAESAAKATFEHGAPGVDDPAVVAKQRQELAGIVQSVHRHIAEESQALVKAVPELAPFANHPHVRLLATQKMYDLYQVMRGDLTSGTRIQHLYAQQAKELAAKLHAHTQAQGHARVQAPPHAPPHVPPHAQGHAQRIHQAPSAVSQHAGEDKRVLPWWAPAAIAAAFAAALIAYAVYKGWLSFGRVPASTAVASAPAPAPTATATPAGKLAGGSLSPRPFANPGVQRLGGARPYGR